MDVQIKIYIIGFELKFKKKYLLLFSTSRIQPEV